MVAGAEGLHQDLNLPYLGVKRTSLPARLNPNPLINQSIPVQSINPSLIGLSNPPNSFSKPVLNKNPQSSDLRNTYNGPLRGPNIPVTLENRFTQKQARNFLIKKIEKHSSNSQIRKKLIIIFYYFNSGFGR